MNWLILLLAGLLEIAWAIGLKYSEGFTRFWPSVWTAITMLASMVLLAIAMKSLPVGTAYAVWVGIGAVGTVVLGIVLFNESADFWRMASVGLIAPRPRCALPFSSAMCAPGFGLSWRVIASTVGIDDSCQLTVLTPARSSSLRRSRLWRRSGGDSPSASSTTDETVPSARNTAKSTASSASRR